MYANPEHAFGGSVRLLGLIERIYAAVQQPELWSDVLEQVSEAIHGESLAIFAALPDAPLVAMTRTDPGAWSAFAGYYAGINPLIPACDRFFADGEPRYAELAVPDRELVKTEFYNDFFRPNNMHYSLGLRLSLGPDLPAAYLTCQRPRDKGPFNGHEGLVYETLAPHLQRALGLHLQFAAMRSQKMGLETALDLMGHAVLGLDSKGRVILSNRQAEAMLASGDAVQLKNGALRTVSPKHNHALRKLVAEATATGAANGISAGGSMLVARRSGLSPVRLTVAPFSSALPGRSVQLAALVFLSDPAGKVPSRSAALTTLYALTPSEARVADLLLQGLDAGEIADSLRIVEDTVRFHVKRVLAKTGTHRQAELVRLMASLPAI